MGKMKEMDILAEQCSIEIIDKMYRTCDWALTGPFTGPPDVIYRFKDAHSYLMQLVVNKIQVYLDKKQLLKLKIK
jgi:hypothetical protein